MSLVEQRQAMPCECILYYVLCDRVWSIYYWYIVDIILFNVFSMSVVIRRNIQFNSNFMTFKMTRRNEAVPYWICGIVSIFQMTYQLVNGLFPNIWMSSTISILNVPFKWCISRISVYGGRILGLQNWVIRGWTNIVHWHNMWDSRSQTWAPLIICRSTLKQSLNCI